MAGPQDDITYLLRIDPADTTVDVDVTDRVQSFTTRKGRDRETDTFTPTTATLTLLDTDRRFDPNNPDGPYAPVTGASYGGLIPLRRIRAELDSANVENFVAVDANHYVDGGDVAALDITGDIDVRWFGTLTNWSSGNQSLINKFQSSGDQRSWTMECESGSVRVYISTTGADFPFTSAFAVPFANNEYGGVRFTRVQATGTTTVYFSTDDGATWTTAGSTVVSAGTAIFSSSANVNLGGQSSGLTNPPTGKVLRAEVRNGVDGTLVAAPDFTVLAAGRNLSFEPLTDPYGIVWTGRGAGFDTVVSAGSRIFTGFVTDWSVDYHDGDRQAIVTVTATDGLGTLANCELDTIAAAHSGDTSGVRVDRVLDRAEVAYADPTSIDAGISTFGTTTFGANALDYLQQCAKAEGGYLFVDRNGTLQFLDRHTLLNDSSTALTFADAHAGSGIRYKRLSQSSATDLLYNRATGAGTSGTAQSASDAMSMTAFKPRTLPLGDLLLSTDAETLSLLQWAVQRFKDPEARFSSIELNTMALGNTGVIDGGYADLPGSTGNYLSTPDAAALDITGDICIVVRVAADDWTPAATQTFAAKYTSTANQRSWAFQVDTLGRLVWIWTTAGTGASQLSATSTATVSALVAGTWKYIAVTFDVDDGAAQRVTRFWTSDDGATFTLFDTVTQAGATSIFSSTSQVEIGMVTGVSPFAGKVGHVSIRSGIAAGGEVGGTEVFTFDGRDDLVGLTDAATSFSATTGQTITVNRSGSPDTELVPFNQVQAVALLDLATLVTVGRIPLGGIPAIRYIDFPGTASNYVSAPDASDLDITGDICIVVRVAPDDWTPSSAQTIFSKWTNTGNQRSYRLDLNAVGTLTFQWSATGSDTPSETSSVAAAATAGAADGEWLWLAVTLDVNDGAGGRDARFWYSTDPHGLVDEVEWTQLGTTKHTASTSSIFASTAVVNLSGHTLGVSQPFAGNIAHASIRSGFTGSGEVGGTEVFRFDGDTDLNIPATATSFTASTGETLTVNGTPTFGSVTADTITRTCIVDGIEHNITPGSWDTVIRLGNADTRPFLVLDHPTLGRLNSNRLAF